jgi:hypothetical protein
LFCFERSCTYIDSEGPLLSCDVITSVDVFFFCLQGEGMRVRDRKERIERIEKKAAYLHDLQAQVSPALLSR